MKVHYFQENVATANTMLLPSRLYLYSPIKFFKLLTSHYFSASFNPEIIFDLQSRSLDSIPDATITQDSFKIVVETKMNNCFREDQLIRHLNAFNGENSKVLITLAPKPMCDNKKSSFEKMLNDYNKDQMHPITHINTTFEEMANAVKEMLDEDRDYEMMDIVEDYLDYCYNDGLINASDAWKFMRMQLAGKTMDYDINASVYFNRADVGFRPYTFLGLYKNKSIRAVGKVIARITAIKTKNGVKFENEMGELTDERKDLIKKIITEIIHENTKHRYFFVDKFYETDFKKISPRASWGSRVFDLTQILKTNKIPDTEELAARLKNETWT